MDRDFHEFSVIKFNSDGNDFVIELMDEPDGSNLFRLTLRMISRVIADSPLWCAGIEMPAPDGEVLSITTESNKVSLLIIWNDFDKKRSATCAYDFECKEIRLEDT